MPHVAFLIHPRSLLTGLAMPAEMLRAADEIHRVHHREPPRLRLTMATLDDRPIRWQSTLALSPTCRLGDLTQVDLLYLPPFWRRPETRVPEGLATLRRLARAGTLICAVSTGAYLPAAAGLLDGRAATTHWSFLDDFEERFPAVELKRQHLITRSENLYCAGSLNATADLTTHFIERFFDAETARGVEAQFSPEIRRPAAQQGYFDGEAGAQPDELMAEAQRWLSDHVGQETDLDELADMLGISRRTLNRRFRRATGRTPVRYLQKARMAEASTLLRDSNLAIAEIGSRVGYDDASYFTTLYRKLTGSTPSHFRAAVRAKLFTPE